MKKYADKDYTLMVNRVKVRLERIIGLRYPSTGYGISVDSRPRIVASTSCAPPIRTVAGKRYRYRSARGNISGTKYSQVVFLSVIRSKEREFKPEPSVEPMARSRLPEPPKVGGTWHRAKT